MLMRRNTANWFKHYPTKEGKKLRWLSGDGRIVSTTVVAFDEQLKICREEYRRRRKKT